MADMQDNFPVANMGEQHIAVVLLVDTSGSMYDGPIEELNKGLQNFYDALQKDSVALGRLRSLQRAFLALEILKV